MPSDFRVKWVDGLREPECASDPNYPDGIDIVMTLVEPSCKVELPHPARRCGYYDLTCRTCGVRVAVTTAGRADDPRSVRVPCKVKAETAAEKKPN